MLGVAVVGGDTAGVSLSVADNYAVCEGVEVLGEKVFHYCSSLREITLPASLRELGRFPFMRCPRDLVIRAPEGSYAAEIAKTLRWI